VGPPSYPPPVGDKVRFPSEAKTTKFLSPGCPDRTWRDRRKRRWNARHSNKIARQGKDVENPRGFATKNIFTPLADITEDPTFDEGGYIRRWCYKDGEVTPDRPPVAGACKSVSADKIVDLSSLSNLAPQQGTDQKDTAGTDLTSCTRTGKLRATVRDSVKFISSCFGLEITHNPNRLSPVCGTVRQSVRRCFPDKLPTLVELSIKTAQKLERSTCQFCKEKKGDSHVYEWLRKRQAEVNIDNDHLLKFTKMVQMNVERGWNRTDFPYIPNGNATLFNSRCDGGNWNEETFSDLCRVVPILSAGKPRVVTLYSEYNSRLLSPLHASLYKSLQRQSWLLVGSPTNQQVSSLTGSGPFVSVDYASATDNIKLRYVRAVIEVLIDKASPPLSDEQKKCLRVLGELRPTLRNVDDLEEGDMADSLGAPKCHSGQPMGSVLSFPILCIVNKTVTDMALIDLFDAKCISFNKCRDHKLLVNGDDLLTREPNLGATDHDLTNTRSNNTRVTDQTATSQIRSSTTPLLDRIKFHGSHVGLVVNTEKTMVDPVEAEINSTLFVDGRKQRKINLAALNMAPDVADTLAYAEESSNSTSSFCYLVKRNRNILAKQERKNFSALRPENKVALCLSKKIKAAMCSLPRDTRPEIGNLFPVVNRPDDFDLPREVVVKTLIDEVALIRRKGLKKPVGNRFRTCRVPGALAFSDAIKTKEKSEEKVLRVLANAFNERRWSALMADDPMSTTILYQSSLTERVSDNPIMDDIVGMIRNFKDSRRSIAPRAECTINQIVSSFIRSDKVVLDGPRSDYCFM